MKELRMAYPDEYKLSIIVRRHDGKVWNRRARRFEFLGFKNLGSDKISRVARTTAKDDFCFAMISKSASWHIADFPEGIPRGRYDVQVFRFDGEIAQCVGVKDYEHKPKIFLAVWSRIVRALDRNRTEFGGEKLAINVSIT